MANILSRLNDRLNAFALKHWDVSPTIYGIERGPFNMVTSDIYPASSTSWSSVAAVWSAVRVLSEDMASLPLFLFEKDDDGGRHKATDHHLYETLHDYANPEMTSFAWRETSMAHLLTWGNCYSDMVYDRLGRLQLYPFRPDRMEVYWRDDGTRGYAYQHPTNGRRVLDPGKVFHVAGLSWDGLKGLSPVALARQTLSLASRAESFGDQFYRNGAQPALVLTVPAGYPETAKANLREAWQANHSVASGKGGGTAMLEDGVTVNTLSMPLDDAQFLETRKFQITEIARWFRIPPDKLGDLEHATFSNIEQQELNYVIHSLRPWLVRWEQAIRQQLLRDDPDEVYAEFQMDALLRGDALSRAEALNIQHRAGVVTTDEWRMIENRNPLPDAIGEVPYVSADMVAMSSEPTEPEPVPLDDRLPIPEAV
jgi:HK97 family phage portal protein